MSIMEHNVRVIPVRPPGTMLRFTPKDGRVPGDVVFGPYGSRTEALMALVHDRLPNAFASDREYEMLMHSNDGRQTMGEVNLGCPQ